MIGKRSNKKSIFHPHFIANNLIGTHLKKAAVYSRGTILDLGCGEKPYKDILSLSAGKYYGIDAFREEGRCPDVLADIQCLPFKKDIADTVIATQVLEHVPEPEAVLKECFRILKRNGCLIIIVPQTWALHCAPWDYYRFTSYGISYLLSKTGFQIISIKAHGGFGSVVGQMLNNYFYHSFGGKMDASLNLRKIIHNLLHSICPLLFALNVGIAKLLDHFDLNRLEVLDHIVIAQKN